MERIADAERLGHVAGCAPDEAEQEKDDEEEEEDLGDPGSSGGDPSESENAGNHRHEQKGDTPG